MAKKSNFKLIYQVKDSKFETDVWYAADKCELHIWRHGKRHEFIGVKDEFQAYEIATGFISIADSSKTSLNNYLHLNNIKLTQLEVDTLEAILGQGSYYEESACWEDNENGHHPYVDGSCFIGWDIDEKELPGCRGAISSLVKKGILNVNDDELNFEVMQAYYIKVTPTFKKGGYYHQLDIDSENLK